MLQDLPEFAYQHLLEQHLSDLEVKTLRLVSKECKSMVDTSLTTLRPKDIANLKLGEVVKLFANLEKLDLTQHDGTAAPKDYEPDFQQLSALRRLKSLKVHWDRKCDLIRQVVPGGGLTGLTTLQYEAEAMADEDLAALSCMVGLRELSLHSASGRFTKDGCPGGIRGTGLVSLKNLPHLQSLDVRNTNITTVEGLQALATLTQLTALNVNNAIVDCEPDPDDSGITLPRRDIPEVLDLLSCLTGLRELHLQSNGIVPNQDLLDKLAGLRSLTALDIDAPLHDDYSHAPIEGSALFSLRDLRVLKATWWNVYFKPQVAPSGNSVSAELALTELTASTWRHTDHQMLLHAAVCGGKLKDLVLNGDYSYDKYEDIPHMLIYATALTSLKFNNCNVGSLSGLQRAQALKRLIFEGCRFLDAEEVRHLSSLTNMETLRFDCTLHSDTCLTPFLGDLSALVTLQIPESEAVTTELLDRMAQLSALQDLDLTCYHASARLVNRDQGDLCRLLAAVPQLTALQMRGLNIQDRELNAIRHLKHLRYLNLYGGNFTDSALRMLTGLTALRYLNLGGCDNITDEGFRAVVIPLSRQSLAQVDVGSRYRFTPLSSARSMGLVCCKIYGV